MASLRIPVLGLLAAGLTVALSSCAPSASTPGDDDSANRGYEQAIAVVLLAESNAGGRAFGLEFDDDTARVEVAVDDREVEVEVDTAGPSIRDQRDDDDLDADDREALESASTSLADALRIAAAAHREGAGIEEAGLDRRDDGAVWTIEFTDDTEVDVAVDDGATTVAER